MKNKISIGIVTFKERREIVKELVRSIRENTKEEVDIILIINGNNEELTDEDYRVDMLNFCATISNCYPFVCPEFKSLSKLWNNIVIFSRTDYVLIMGDDVKYEADIVKIIDEQLKSNEVGFFTLNHGFSHFVVTKQMLHTLGYFDERLLALGEEDGDMVHRYAEMFNENIPTLMVSGIYNAARYDNMPTNSEVHVDNKPAVNKKLREAKYTPDANGFKGMWDTPMVKVWEDYQQYPYEMFVKKNKHNMKKFDSLNETYE